MEVPACRICALRLHVIRLGFTFVTWAVFIATVVLVVTKVESQTVGLVIAAAVWLTFVSLLAGLRRWFPPPFELEAAPDSVTFGFRDLSLGYEFRALNPAAHDAGGLTSA